jgi:hypothetical protein
MILCVRRDTQSFADFNVPGTLVNGLLEVNS